MVSQERRKLTKDNNKTNMVKLMEATHEVKNTQSRNKLTDPMIESKLILHR